jgi:hypothetical protein
MLAPVKHESEKFAPRAGKVSSEDEFANDLSPLPSARLARHEQTPESGGVPQPIGQKLRLSRLSASVYAFHYDKHLTFLPQSSVTTANYNRCGRDCGENYHISEITPRDLFILRLISNRILKSKKITNKITEMKTQQFENAGLVTRGNGHAANSKG